MAEESPIGGEEEVPEKALAEIAKLLGRTPKESRVAGLIAELGRARIPKRKMADALRKVGVGQPALPKGADFATAERTIFADALVRTVVAAQR